MRPAVAALSLALLFGGGALADPAAPAAPGDRHDLAHDRGPRQAPSLFISPSGEPFRAGPGEPYPVAKWFAGADKKGDGRLDRAAFRADAKRFFDVLDKNHDGVIDGFELNDYEQQIAPEISGAYGAASGDGRRRGRPDADGGDGPRGGRRGGLDGGGLGAGGAAVLQGAAPFDLLAEPEPVAACDLDLSGHITLEEFLTVADRRFDKLDVKQQGYLTLADLPKTQAQLMAEGLKRGKRQGPPPGGANTPPDAPP
jgi:hypothetical protein